MKVRAVVVAVCCSLGAASAIAASEEETFAKSLEYTRSVVSKHHLICLVDLDPLDRKGKTSFRYDRYPEVERLELDGGATFARKKGKAWLKSSDWAKTGAKVKSSKADELDALASFVDAPLQNRAVAKDETQGAMIVTLIKREPRDSGGERLFYEMRRERATGFFYPQFVFDTRPGAPDDEALLIGYAGLMYSGEEKVKVNLNYSYMFLIDVKPAKTEGSDTSTPPISERVYSFDEIAKQRAELSDKVVRVRISRKVAKSDAIAGGMSRLTVKDTSRASAPTAELDFSNATIAKLRIEENGKGILSPYVLVRPALEDEPARLIAIGTRFTKRGDGSVEYSW